MAPQISAAREAVQQASHIAILTGAGISAESGIPTFRGAGGLWRNFRAEELATPQAFARDPKFVWEWYDWRRFQIAQAQPNAAHLALAELERAKPHFTLITQNVDGLHDLAGSRAILKVHGDIWTLRCLDCGDEKIDRAVSLIPLPPQCACGGVQRPGVVWFGEGLPQDVWSDSIAATEAAEVFLVIGTSALVHPAAGLVELAKSHGATVIEINIAESAVSGLADYCLLGEATRILPQLL